MKTIFIDRTGQRFGRWLVLRLDKKYWEDPISGRKFNTRWWCRCDCGTEGSIDVGNLVVHSRSCGCLKRERASEVMTTHGHTKVFTDGKKTQSRTYRAWAEMKRRCYNEKARCYHNYGGRGISVCDRWFDSFENFLSDMGECPKRLTLDRWPNNDGNYEPANCRWASRKQQNNNKRIATNATLLTFNGETMLLVDWGKRVKIKSTTLRYRLAQQWPIEQILTKAVGNIRRTAGGV